MVADFDDADHVDVKYNDNEKVNVVAVMATAVMVAM